MPKPGRKPRLSAEIRRREVVRVVSAQPGLTARGLGRALDWSNGSMHRTLKGLVEDGVIVRRRLGRGWNHFLANGPAHIPREEPLMTLQTWLSGKDWVTESYVLDYAQQKWSWARSTTQHRLSRLVEFGAVKRIGQRQSSRYKTNP